MRPSWISLHMLAWLPGGNTDIRADYPAAHRRWVGAIGETIERLTTNETVAVLDVGANNGFWAKKFKGSNLGCTKDVWIPFMSGFGGITVALMPNKTLYYYFSDDQDFAWDRAVIASNKISPFCPSS